MTEEDKRFLISKVVNTALTLATAIASYFLGTGALQ